MRLQKDSHKGEEISTRLLWLSSQANFGQKFPSTRLLLEDVCIKDDHFLGSPCDLVMTYTKECGSFDKFLPLYLSLRCLDFSKLHGHAGEKCYPHSDQDRTFTCSNNT
ncbi:hypothetical protein HanIR_Chr13g0669111 [Helianthus annuus]|nr:hypothetical protein HanIR_Chr13g0669111 [Helianthus annuus]